MQAAPLIHIAPLHIPLEPLHIRIRDIRDEDQRCRSGMMKSPIRGRPGACHKHAQRGMPIPHIRCRALPCLPYAPARI